MTSFKGLAPLRFCNTKCNNPVAMKKEAFYRKSYQDFNPKIDYLPACYVQRWLEKTYLRVVHDFNQRLVPSMLVPLRFS